MKKYRPPLIQFLFGIQFLMFWGFQTVIVAFWWNEKIGFNALSLEAMALIVIGPLIVFLVEQLMLKELHAEVENTKREIKELQAKRRDSIPRRWRREIIKRDNQTCTYCGRRGSPELDPDRKPWHLDHIVPQDRGGPTHRENLTLSCSTCNLSKGNKAAFEYLRFCVPSNGKVTEKISDLEELEHA